MWNHNLHFRASSCPPLASTTLALSQVHLFDADERAGFGPASADVLALSYDPTAVAKNRFRANLPQAWVNSTGEVLLTVTAVNGSDVAGLNSSASFVLVVSSTSVSVMTAVIYF